jgi:antibiotic biosynthesis monooxygenase (ABM) superfamily enzyme
MHRFSRQKIPWASWSTRRVITVAALYGLVLGCVVGITQALVDHDTVADAIELIALNVVVWWVIAPLALFGIRWLARHPRRDDHAAR